MMPTLSLFIGKLSLLSLLCGLSGFGPRRFPDGKLLDLLGRLLGGLDSHRLLYRPFCGLLGPTFLRRFLWHLGWFLCGRFGGPFDGDGFHRWGGLGLDSAVLTPAVGVADRDHGR